MSDEVASDGDEAVGGAFDMASWFDDSYVVLGAVGTVKLIDPDGSIVAHDFVLGLNHFEALGMLLLHEDELRTSTYVENHYVEVDEDDE